MKQLLIFLFVLFHLTSFSQSFWSKVVDDQNFNKSSFITNSLFQDSLILVGGYLGTTSCPTSGLFAYDLKGNRTWEADGFFDVIYTDSNSIYTVGHIWMDDVGGLEQVVFSKFDKNGKEIFQSSYPEIPHHYWFEFVPISLDINGNGAIVSSSKNSIIQADSLGKVISKTQMKFHDDILSIQFIGSDSLLINTESTFYKSDLSLIHLDSISFDEKIVSALIQNDTIYSLFPNRLVILDTNLNILDTIITSHEIDFKKIKPFGGNLWIQGIQGNQAKIMQLHNLLFSDTLTFDLLVDSADFLVSSGNVIFTGNSNSGQIAIYSFNKNFNPNAVVLPDIEIVDFGIDSIKIEYNNFPTGGVDKIPIGYSYVTKMIIKNNGEEPITSFGLYLYLHGGMNCLHTYFYKKYTDIFLLPNQNLTINLNRISEYGMRYNKICFECLAPNSQIENNIESNSLCKTFVITGLVDVTKSQKCQVYPNPTKDFLKLEFEENGEKYIRLSNLNGSLLFETKISDCETNLDLSSFDSGVYLLSITSESIRFSQKIVKE